MALPQITITEATLVADPELRYGQSGTAVVNFRVASNSRRKNESTGQWEDGDTTFLSVSAFRGLAENIASEFSKGQKISVTGQLKQREYEKDGQKRTVYEVNAQNVSKPVSRFNDSEGSSTPQGGGNNAYGAQGQPQGGFGGQPQGGFDINEAAPF